MRLQSQGSLVDCCMPMPPSSGINGLEFKSPTATFTDYMLRENFIPQVSCYDQLAEQEEQVEQFPIKSEYYGGGSALSSLRQRQSCSSPANFQID